jgi:hypothetical protein
MLVFFRMFSTKRFLGVVLREGGYTTLMISTMGKHITYTINLVAWNEKYGYDIVILGIHHSDI